MACKMLNVAQTATDEVYPFGCLRNERPASRMRGDAHKPHFFIPKVERINDTLGREPSTSPSAYDHEVIWHYRRSSPQLVKPRAEAIIHRDTPATVSALGRPVLDNDLFAYAASRVTDTAPTQTSNLHRPQPRFHR